MAEMTLEGELFDRTILAASEQRGTVDSTVYLGSLAISPEQYTVRGLIQQREQSLRFARHIIELADGQGIMPGVALWARSPSPHGNGVLRIVGDETPLSFSSTDRGWVVRHEEGRVPGGLFLDTEGVLKTYVGPMPASRVAFVDECRPLSADPFVGPLWVDDVAMHLGEPAIINRLAREEERLRADLVRFAVELLFQPTTPGPAA